MKTKQISWKSKPGDHIGVCIRHSLRWSLLLLCAPVTVGSVGAQDNLVTHDAYPTRYLAAHGRRALLGGNSGAGLEGWVYPLQLFTGLSPSFREPGSATAIASRPLLRSVEYSPTDVERTYVGPNFTVRERLFVPTDIPGAVLTYTVDGPDPVSVELQFTPVFDLMWPVAFGGQEVHWHESDRAYHMDEPTGRFFAMLGSPDVVRHDDVLNTGAPLQANTVLHLVLGPGKTVRLLFASDNAGWSATEAAYRRLRDHEEDLALEAVMAQRRRREEATLVQTPDAEVNQALLWSQLALDQAWVTNPTLGSGLVAGYGPSRGLARRPQYDWFFADDALVSLPALLLGGELERARNVLLFLFRYQDGQTGMMWHELSQSAAYVNWGKDYPYMFPHVDTTFRFLVGVAAYAEASGDRSLLQAHWPAIDRAYRYCTSLLDPADGLPRVPAGKEGHDEQQHPQQELQLALDWMEAADAYARMAVPAGHPEAAAGARAAAQHAAGVIPGRFWNSQTRFWNAALDAQGRGVGEIRLPSPRSVDLLDRARREEVMDRIAGTDFETPWGARSTAVGSRSFDPESYAQGSVWAASTAEAAEDLWAGDRNREGWNVWKSLLSWLSLDSMGHLHETLSGARFQPQIESVPEQTWSSALLFSSFLQRVVGIEQNGLEGRLKVAPRLPEDWHFLAVQRIRVGQGSVSLRIERIAGGLRLEGSATGEAIDLDFHPDAPPGKDIVWTGVDGGPPCEAVPSTPHGDCVVHLERDGPKQAMKARYVQPASHGGGL